MGPSDVPQGSRAVGTTRLSVNGVRLTFEMADDQSMAWAIRDVNGMGIRKSGVDSAVGMVIVKA